MHTYYFIIPSLPPLSLFSRPPLCFPDLRFLLKTSLSRSDFEQTKVVGLFVDLCNIRSFFLEEGIDPHGNLSEKELDEALLMGTYLPEYVFRFLSKFGSVAEKVRNFPTLLTLFFNEEISKAKGFVHTYLTFEREVRLVLLGLRAKKLKRDLAEELKFEDPADPLVAHLLSQVELDEYEPPAEYQELKGLIGECYGAPLAEYEALLGFRFSRLEQLVEGREFSLDRILCYLIQLMMVEDFFALNVQKGTMVLETFKSG